jgi:hypothetical protein
LRRNALSICLPGALFLLLLLQAPPVEFYLSNSDHGMQLCGGHQVLFGKVPGCDMFSPYGPLVFYTSALGLKLSGSLLGETILCSLGYALALWIMYLLVARHAAPLAGVLVVAAACLLLPRFYKWYFWLFPLAVLLVLFDYAAASPARRRVLALAGGLLLGILWLYRFDIGTTGFFAAAVFVFLVESEFRRRVSRRCMGQLAILGVAAAWPLVAWFALLGVAKGGGACLDFVTVLLDGTRGLLDLYSLPLPIFQAASPGSPSSLLFAGLAFAPLTYLVCGGVGLGAEIRSRATARSRAHLATALVGLSVVHQSLVRCDSSHVLQALSPALVGAGLILNDVFRRPWLRATRSRPGRIALAGRLAYLGAALTAGLILAPAGRSDMAHLTLRPWKRLARLCRPLESLRREPVRDALVEIQRWTEPEEAILVYPTQCQYYVFANRRMSGVFYGYLRGGLAASPWYHRNLEAIHADSPKVVMVLRDFLAMAPGTNGLRAPFGDDAG